MSNSDTRIILALETGLDGGSVSILEKGRQIDYALGAGNLSKSEDILAIVENLLKRNGIEKRTIGQIIVSDGPGSLTGLRIGLAIAKGLAAAWSAEVCKISVLEALTYQLKAEDGRVISALYTKKREVFFIEVKIKDGKRSGFGEIVQKAGIADFVDTLDSLKGEKISVVLNEQLLLALAEYRNNAKSFEKMHFLCVKGNLAEVIGLAIIQNRVR